MAVPKRKTSKAKAKSRKTHWKLTAKNSSACPECGAAKLPHVACSSCGKYNGIQILDIKE
ncbi:MAG: 50S ribosomal protein L32 [Candidatus Cloacimonadota bacterium]|nr:MAG: 50S ribosomal protein L32 [Candidatus Cloacimonadota bacterium]PIE78828.1 MAG: 50S ribosomal protein L32 [Candidatus Delongbacteria bacterium]